MRNRRYRPQSTLSHEFELDLAPLLAVMVKLVPVLLVSSAFVQMMMVETDLPQAVKEAVVRNEKAPTANLQLDISGKDGLRLILALTGQAPTVTLIPNRGDGGFNLSDLHARLVEIKTAHPDLFRLELNPGANIAYRDIVKIMDEARKAKDSKIHFPVTDPKTQTVSETDYMFPNVVFVNMMEG